MTWLAATWNGNSELRLAVPGRVAADAGNTVQKPAPLAMVVTLRTAAAAPPAPGTRTSVVESEPTGQTLRVSRMRLGLASGAKRPAEVGPLSS